MVLDRGEEHALAKAMAKISEANAVTRDRTWRGVSMPHLSLKPPACRSLVARECSPDEEAASGSMIRLWS